MGRGQADAEGLKRGRRRIRATEQPQVSELDQKLARAWELHQPGLLLNQLRRLRSDLLIREAESDRNVYVVNWDEPGEDGGPRLLGSINRTQLTRLLAQLPDQCGPRLVAEVVSAYINGHGDGYTTGHRDGFEEGFARAFERPDLDMKLEEAEERGYRRGLADRDASADA